MSEPLPDAAITAATEANDAYYDNEDDLKYNWRDGSDVRELARQMLEAAAPALRAQGAATLRERIRHIIIGNPSPEVALALIADLLDGSDG